MSKNFYVVLVGDREDRYPMVFSRKTKATEAKLNKDWNKATDIVRAKFPGEWQFNDVEEEMKKLGYKPVEAKWIIGE
ncbi:MAG: hypothetical protein GTN64_07450 [Candidatus Latescibacteria bacterium]|nr:hypothetical protein [Candidatus Latescibacterota bacterium]NIO78438.1 hypothetical protein [Candidatus Latescibacterota bacterium]